MTRLPLSRASQAKYGLVFCLYLAQGIATGFLLAGLPAVLRRQGLPLEILWVTFVPPIFYSIKFLWAPLADRHWLPALGRRRTWLLPATLGVSVAFLVLSQFPPDRGLLAATAALLFISLSGATMDIATDAYTVELLTPAERGLGNGLQSAGLAAGVMVGEGVMLLLVERLGWAGAMATLGALVPLVAAPGLLRREGPPPAEASASATRPGLAAFFRRPEAPLTLVLALATGLCYFLILPILGPFLVDQGLSLGQVGSIGLGSAVAGVAGALVGGAAINVMGFRRAYLAVLGGGMVFALVASGVASGEPRGGVLAPLVWSGRFVLGALFAIFYANVMGWCSRAQAATDYTMISSGYAAMAVAGGSLATQSAARFGYHGHFLAVAGFHLVTLGIVVVLYPRIVAGVARAVGVAAAAVLLLVATASGATAQERVSRLGVYRGYSSARYDGFERSSRYLTMRDGVRLAVDLIRPTQGGVLHTERLPVVWSHHRYHRASVVGGTLRTTFDWARPLLEHGYVVAVVDARGAGASFGDSPGFYGAAEVRDTYEVTEWLGAQPWSSGKVGMYGRSYLGHIQYFAAGERPPSLKAIFPEMAVFDFYDLLYPGGIFQEYALPTWRFLTRHLDQSRTFDWFGVPFGPAAPVDGDSGRALRDLAVLDHGRNLDVGDLFRAAPSRDAIEPTTGEAIHRSRSPSRSVREINRSGIAIYHLSGWLDPAPRDAFLWYANLTVPQKLVMGPWFHSQGHGYDNVAEHLRWYDYWLKGIDNGIMREPPIHYGTLNAPADSIWRAAWAWPLPAERRTRFYFGAGPTGTVASANDGRLRRTRPASTGADRRVVDTTATVGKANRWVNGYGGPPGYPDLAPNDARGWTYTSEPLPARLEVTGHPVVRLWVTADTTDADLFVYLEEVSPEGRSSYVTEGMARASRSRLGPAPHRNLGLPYRPALSGTPPLVLQPDRPVELVFDLLPTSVYFRPGHRIRLTVTGADRDNFPAPRRAPTVAIHRSPRYPSSIELPVIPARARSK